MSKIACMTVLGYTGGGTKDSIQRCIDIHQDVWRGTQYYEYELNSEGFIVTLITNKDLYHLCDDVDSTVNDISCAITDHDETGSFRIGQTDLPSSFIDAEEYGLDDWTIEYVACLAGSNRQGTEYYEELDMEDVVEDWNGDCPM